MKTLVVSVFAGWLAGCSSLPSDATVPYGDATIYVVARGWHTDIGLSVEDVSGPLELVEHDFPGARFIIFGFGERAFYMAQEAGSGDMLTALFPGESAILVTALGTLPTEAFRDQQVATLRLPQSGVDRIVARLWNSLQKSPDGTALRLADGPYPGSAFYAADETYHGFYTCNTWTVRVLRDAGVPVNPSGVLFTWQVMHQVNAVASMQARVR